MTAAALARGFRGARAAVVSGCQSRSTALALLLFVWPSAAAEPQRPAPLQSGIEFVSPDIRAMQADEFANPGMLWVARGETLWQESAGRDAKSCAGCHGDAKTSMRGAAPRYPRIDAGGARLINLEGRIQQCRERRQLAEPLKHESAELLALTAYVANQSRGMSMKTGVRSLARNHQPGP